MKLPRRQFLHLTAGAATLQALPRIVWAQTYPTKPVRIVVGFAPGGGVDAIARIIGQSLSERFGQQFVIDNRPGAGSNIGAEVVVRSAPDGYTLLLATTSNAINATLYDRLSFNLIRDIVPVAGIMRGTNVMVVNPSVPATTVPGFITYAKAKPGKINVAIAGGTGSVPHVFSELFKMMTGVALVSVPYRGAPQALADLISGQVQVGFTPLIVSIEHIHGGRLRALAVTTTSRQLALPDIPTVGEFVSGYEANAWFGVAAPRNTPAQIIDKLNNEINETLADPKIRARIAGLGGTVLVGTPADFGKLMAEETEKWAKVVKFAGIKAD
jgi:tripartite-type tricarboxylate transporter receptor subunit TctC